MNSKRKTMLVAALVVAVVAAAGIGYATAAGYTATTNTNTQNSVADSEYLVIYADSEAYTSFSKAYAFNTESTYANSKVMVKFGDCYDITGSTLPTNPEEYAIDITESNNEYSQASHVTTATTGYKAVLVKTVTLTIDFTNANGKDASVAATFSGLTVPTSGEIAKLFLVTAVGTSDIAVSALSNGTVTTAVESGSNATITYSIYIAVPNAAVEYGTYANDVMANGSISFVATSV